MDTAAKLEPQTTRPFRAGVSNDADWRRAVASIVRQLGPPRAENRLGFVYLSDRFQPHLAEIEILLRQTTGVPHWVGAVGYGVVGTGAEHFGGPGLSVLVTDLPERAFRVFQIGREGPDAMLQAHRQWIEGVETPLALVHADPIAGFLVEHLDAFGNEANAYLFGGLSASKDSGSQLADGVVNGRPDRISGVMLSPHFAEVQSALTQGCTPIGPARRITEADGHVIKSIENRPALEVLKEDAGPEIANDLRKAAGVIFAGLPVTGSDTGDYLVRTLIGIDVENDLIAIGDEVGAGDRMLFCRRDADTAVGDMNRMLDSLAARVGDRPIRGGVYISCCARGPNQFNGGSTETDLIHARLGDFPLTGFFANGEISGGRLYGFTGILALFL